MRRIAIIGFATFAAAATATLGGLTCALFVIPSTEFSISERLMGPIGVFFLSPYVLIIAAWRYGAWLAVGAATLLAGLIAIRRVAPTVPWTVTWLVVGLLGGAPLATFEAWRGDIMMSLPGLSALFGGPLAGIMFAALLRAFKVLPA